MPTQKQSAAARRNSAKSTGPKTPEGKAVSRFNALRHGLRSRFAVQPGDDPAEFAQLCADLADIFQPQNRAEQLHVEKMALAEWKLARLERRESLLLIEDPDPAQIQLGDRISVHQDRLERASLRVHHALQRLAKGRPQSKEEPVREIRVRWVESDPPPGLHPAPPASPGDTVTHSPSIESGPKVTWIDPPSGPPRK